MKRGEIYLVNRLSTRDPRASRPFVVVSRQGLLDSRYSTISCVPVYSNASRGITELPVGEAEGLKHRSVLRCDEITNVPRTALTNFIGSLKPERFAELNRALAIALDIDPDDIADL